MRILFFLLLTLVFHGFHCAALDADHFVFSGFHGAQLDVDGMATVTPDGLLELTNGTVQLQGHAFFPAPFRLRGSPGGAVRSFSASFVFGILTSYPNLSCHGITFLVAPSNNFSTALGGQYLGLTNIANNGNASNHIFAAELDTLQTIEFEDIDNNHVAVNINGLHSVRSHPAGYYAGSEDDSFRSLTLISGDVMQAWVEYHHETARIDVTIAPFQMPKPARPLVSATYNLSDVLTTTGPAYVGFSSTTGPIHSWHYILGWSFGIGGGPAPAIDLANLPKLPRLGPEPRSKVEEILTPVAVAAFILALGTAAVLFLRRRLRYAEVREDWEVEFGPHRFSYKDLFHATHGFDDKHLLGVGGFGKVYRGVLQTSGSEVAVKKVRHESRQGMREFVAEVVSIGHIRHRNVVQLLGYCRRKGELLLVYGYMPNGSLDQHLHRDDDDRGDQKPVLDWAHRFQILKDVASGLLYLHEKWEKVVVHRDIKASNVLLDHGMNGRLGDFGLSRLYDHGTDPQTTHMVGTVGYMAPELVRTGKASPPTDVFAFGTLLLEVTCGQRPVVEDARGDQPLLLVDRVLEHWHAGTLLDAVDARLQGDYDAHEVCLVLKLGLLCVHPDTRARPTVQQIVEYLDGETPLPELVPTHLSFNVMAIMQNKGFDPRGVAYPTSSLFSIGSISDLSGGR